MKIYISITIFYALVLSNAGIACNCFLGSDNFYEAFSKAEYSCVGKVIRKIDASQYEFEVLRTFKGSFEKVITIQSLPVPSCGLGELSVGDIYLITPNYIKEKKLFDLYRCKHNRQNTSVSFKNDTTCLSSFSQTNVYLDVPYFSGEIKDGKRQGNWHEYYYFYSEDSTTIHHYKGTFVNDKKEGVWTDEKGIQYVYRDGKLMLSKENKRKRRIK